MKKFWKDFKDFAFKGNVLDMAIGVIIAGAFSKIVTSLVEDIIMPLIGKLTGGATLADLVVGGIPLGHFIQAVIDFLIIAVVLFIVLKIVMKASKKKEEEEAPAGPTDTELLTEIRDLLKNK